jgi:PTH1 family peptidyl-tRNA hydrolase
MKMIVGLGNPGKKYETTRHNVGFIVVDEIAKQLNIVSYQNKYNAHIATAEYNNQKVLLVKPQTYMNLSGEAVLNLAQYYKIEAEDVLVINDDMDLPTGSIRIRSFGGAAGQKGLKNIIDLLKTNAIPRIRIGIDKNPNIEAADYVLGKFDKESIPLIQAAIIKAKEAALKIVSSGIEAAMNTYNMKDNGNNTTAN